VLLLWLSPPHSTCSVWLGSSTDVEEAEDVGEPTTSVSVLIPGIVRVNELESERSVVVLVVSAWLGVKITTVSMELPVAVCVVSGWSEAIVIVSVTVLCAGE
jgi:hypothetical protein